MKTLGSIRFGEVTIDILSNTEKLTMAELQFPIGVAAQPHQHVNEEIDYVLEGTFETEENGKIITLKKGDFIHVKSNTLHSLKCVGNETGKILTIWTPSRQDLIDKL
jgi:quercetin dioxygenase-like cupin family protein